MNSGDPCGLFRDGVMDSLDGALHPAARDAARAHEQACSACAGLAAAIRSQADLLAGLPRPAAPPGLGERIERALDARRSAAVSRRWSGWAAVAAAAAVLAVVLLPLHRDPSAPPAHRTVRVVDVELPDRGTLLGRFAPNYENPTASPLDPLVANEQR
jgi:predicted anti-sigma-YlaC factor YlaD